MDTHKLGGRTRLTQNRRDRRTPQCERFELQHYCCVSIQWYLCTRDLHKVQRFQTVLCRPNGPPMRKAALKWCRTTSLIVFSSRTWQTLANSRTPWKRPEKMAVNGARMTSTRLG